MSYIHGVNNQTMLLFQEKFGKPQPMSVIMEEQVCQRSLKTLGKHNKY